MLSNQVLLKSITDMKGITGAEVSVWSLEGECLFSTNDIVEKQYEIIEQYLLIDVEDEEYTSWESEFYVRGVYEEENPCYLLMFQGLTGDMDVIGGLCVSQLESLITAYKERLSKGSFLLNLLQGNISDVELNQKAERVHISVHERRVVFVIEPKKEEDELVVQTLKSLYVTGITDFVIEMEKGHIVLIKQLTTTDSDKDIRQIAEIIVDTLNMEAMVSVIVGYGTVIHNLRDIPRSYREGITAIEVGRSFEAGKKILAYKELGIGRLIHQLSDELCEEFLMEILGEEGLAQFDDDTMQAAYKFFENDLNISRTARELYVHRNTLSFRLEKIQAKTGLDVRVFEDAITFKLAIMVSNHMEFVKSKKV